MTAKGYYTSFRVKSLILAVSVLVLGLRIIARATNWNKTALSPFTENFNIPFDVDVLPDYPFNLYFHNQKWLFKFDADYDPNYPAHTHIELQKTDELKFQTNFSTNPVVGSRNDITLWRQDLIDPKPTEPISIKIKAGIATENETEIPYSLMAGVIGKISINPEEYIRLGWQDYDQGSNIVLETQTTSWVVVPSFKLNYEDTIEFSFTLLGTTIFYSVIQNTTTLAKGTKNVATFPYTAKIRPLIGIQNRYRASDTFTAQQLSIKSWVDTAGTTN